jgi:hypothetical protein
LNGELAPEQIAAGQAHAAKKFRQQQAAQVVSGSFKHWKKLSVAKYRSAGFDARERWQLSGQADPIGASADAAV